MISHRVIAAIEACYLETDSLNSLAQVLACVVEAAEDAEKRLIFISEHGLKLKALGIEPGRYESDITLGKLNEALAALETALGECGV